jgi:2-oxo-3-hexenedioate decarboxylase/2-keto-4-pentenoate hydratase
MHGSVDIAVITEAADLLDAAQADRAPIPQLTERYPRMSLAEAHAIQQVNIALDLTGKSEPVR